MEETKGELGSHFVLIHGLCGGGWCWFKVKCLLESSGHKATALDLRASGTDPADVTAIQSFRDYNLPLERFFAALPGGEKVILVGHSAGGLSVTNALRKFPDKVDVAVYVGASMLKSGYQSSHDFKIGVPNLSEYGDVYEYPQGFEQPPISVIFKKEYLRTLVYPMSSLEDITLASILSRPGPIRALVSIVEQDDPSKGANEIERVRRVYIKTVQDKVMKPQQQEAMIEKWPPQEVYAIDSDHSPFFSNPFVLVSLLLKAASLS